MLNTIMDPTIIIFAPFKKRIKTACDRAVNTTFHLSFSFSLFFFSFLSLLLLARTPPHQPLSLSLVFLVLVREQPWAPLSRAFKRPKHSLSRKPNQKSSFQGYEEGFPLCLSKYTLYLHQQRHGHFTDQSLCLPWETMLVAPSGNGGTGAGLGFSRENPCLLKTLNWTTKKLGFLAATTKATGDMFFTRLDLK